MTKLKYLRKVLNKLKKDELELFRKSVENEIDPLQYQKDLEENTYNQIEIRREIKEIQGKPE